MTKLLLMICFLLLSAPISLSQDITAKEAKSTSPEEAKLVNELNCRLMAMQIALSGTQDLDSDLEIVEYQKPMLAKLGSDYKEMFLTIKEYEKDDDIQTGLALCLTTMDTFEHRLSSEILLPHQSTALRTMVFTKLLNEQDGDLISTLATYYPKQFLFNDTQKKRMDEIKATTIAKVKEAKREFQEKLKKISSDAKEKINTVLTPQQSKTLSELSGIVP